MNILKDYETYQGSFSAAKFWGKIKGVAKKAGVKVIYVALILYYELTDPDIDTKEKAVIIGALGYFILPIDLIPDTIPVAGFTDDLAALIAAYKFVEHNITPEIKTKAKTKLAEWFGDVDENEIIIEE